MSLKTLEQTNLHYNKSQAFIPGAGAGTGPIPGPGPGPGLGPNFYPSTLLNTRSVNGKSKRLIDLKQSIDFFRELKVMSYFSNHVYCMQNQYLAIKVPSGRLKVNVNIERSSRSVIVNFKGPVLTKFQWETRGNELTTYRVEGIKSHNLVLVEKEWQNDFLAVRSSLFATILDGLLLNSKHKSTIQFIRFVGHGIGGAYATLAGLSWKIETFLMDGLGTIPEIKFSDFEISTITFGAPRVGNAVFARLVNKLLKVHRITYFNDHVPHFLPRELGNIYLEHFEREYWILPGSCECSTEKNNREYSFYECKGFDYDSQGLKYYDVSLESLFPDGVRSGENE
ncbi:hypothetical protein G9A89_001220, partial [Geosiphon pyriformis]